MLGISDHRSDVEVDGVKHRVIPRDFQLDPIRDLPLHVDFMRLGEGATIRVNIPIHVRNAEQSPGVKRGGTVSIVTHSVEVRCRADAIPTPSRSMSASLDINHSRHLSDITLPEGVRSSAAGTSRWSRSCRRQAMRKKSKPLPRLPLPLRPLPLPPRRLRVSGRGAWRGSGCRRGCRLPARRRRRRGAEKK